MPRKDLLDLDYLLLLESLLDEVNILLLNFYLLMSDYLFWLLENRGEFLDDCFNGVEFLHHLLVVSMALSRVTCLNEFTHHDINS